MSYTRPKLADIATVIKIYNYSYELDTTDILKLYPGASKDYIARKKRKVKEYMKEKAIPSNDRHTVDTDIAFEAWGINIKAIEKKYSNLIKLGFLENVPEVSG